MCRLVDAIKLIVKALLGAGQVMSKGWRGMQVEGHKPH
jgi:hypothetical protein